MARSITFTGTDRRELTLTFEIERNPEEASNPPGSPCAYGVWEKLEAEPESDEIVRCFSSHAEAENWIFHITKPENQAEYLATRGLPSGGV